MFKELLIKYLGGHTQKEFNEIEKQANFHKLKSFRVGDPVYIIDPQYDNRLRYLLKSYNNGQCWYVSTTQNDTHWQCFREGVHIKNIVHKADLTLIPNYEIE